MITKWETLGTELANDPFGLSYATMTDVEAAASLNGATRTRNKSSLTASEVLNAVDAAEYRALTAEKKSAFWGLLGMGNLNPFGIEVEVIKDVFGNDSITMSNLAGIRTESISRAVELGLPEVHEGHITRVRA